MPVVFRHKGFRFFFYANEGSPRELVHVHVRSGAGEAKLWLEPQVRVANSVGFDAATLRELTEVAQTNARLQERAARGASPCKPLFGGTRTLAVLSWKRAIDHVLMRARRQKGAIRPAHP